MKNERLKKKTKEQLKENGAGRKDSKVGGGSREINTEVEDQEEGRDDEQTMQSSSYLHFCKLSCQFQEELTLSCPTYPSTQLFQSIRDLQ